MFFCLNVPHQQVQIQRRVLQIRESHRKVKAGVFGAHRGRQKIRHEISGRSSSLHLSPQPIVPFFQKTPYFEFFHFSFSICIMELVHEECGSGSWSMRNVHYGIGPWGMWIVKLVHEECGSGSWSMRNVHYGIGPWGMWIVKLVHEGCALWNWSMRNVDREIGPWRMCTMELVHEECASWNWSMEDVDREVGPWGMWIVVLFSNLFEWSNRAVCRTVLYSRTYCYANAVHWCDGLLFNMPNILKVAFWANSLKRK